MKFIGAELPNQCDRLPWNWGWHDPIRCKLPWLCRGGTSRCFLKGHKTKQFENSHCNLNIQEPSSRSMGTTTIQRELSLPGESTLVLFGFQWNVCWNVSNLVLFGFHLISWKRYAEELGCLPAVPWPTFMDGVQANVLYWATKISRKQDSSLSWLHIEPGRL